MNIEIIPLLSFVIVTTFTPGPNNISSASMAMVAGYRKTTGYLAGIFSGFFLIMILCAFLSSTLLKIMPAAETCLKWTGSLYIIYLAFVTLKSTYTFKEDGILKNAFVKGFLLQLFNPKAIIYGLTLYSTFLLPIKSETEYLCLFAFMFASTTFAATSIWALSGAIIREKMGNETVRKSVNTVLSFLLIWSAAEIAGLI